jgi:hypothetical protein
MTNEFIGRMAMITLVRIETGINPWGCDWRKVHYEVVGNCCQALDERRYRLAFLGRIEHEGVKFLVTYSHDNEIKVDERGNVQGGR